MCRLLKSLNGLKQAPRQWNTKLLEAILHLGFIQSHHDHSLFLKKTGNDLVLILVYVDDMLVTGSDLQLIKETKASLQQVFNIKDLGGLRYFLGIEFARRQGY